MRKEYSKVLKDYFQKKMETKFPQFQKTKYKSIYIFPGEITYTWPVDDNLKCFIILIPGLTGNDEFFIEIGWSKKGLFPEFERPIGCPTKDRKEFEKDEFICRLDHLWSSNSFGWKFYKLENMTDVSDFMKNSQVPIPVEKVREIVLPQVDDAIVKLEKYGLPYLSEFVSHQT